MQITDFLKKEAVKVGMTAKTKDEALKELVDLLVDSGQVDNKRKLLSVLREREDLGSTGIGQGLAIPHGKCDCVSALCCAVGVSKNGVNFDSLDGERVYVFCLLVAPDQEAGLHLKALARVASLLKDRYFRRQLQNSRSEDEILTAIKREEKTKY
jgi:PTS system nitrogen regulatory IIA component